MGGNAPRILSLDDYFTVENDVETTDPNTGKSITKKVTSFIFLRRNIFASYVHIFTTISVFKEMQYEYDADLEPSYQESLLKSFKKTVSDGFFPFIIVDCINDKLKHYEEMCNFAKSKGFQVRRRTFCCDDSYCT